MKRDWAGTIWEWLCTNDCLKGMLSIEGKTMLASNSERKRWLENGAVLINGKKPKPFDKMELPIIELVFFPNSKRKITMV